MFAKPMKISCQVFMISLYISDTVSYECYMVDYIYAYHVIKDT